ncbi:MAG: DUF1822 family protein [Drouetiella hepatica Uher 2000/2452]|jgi:hypothetical protein|uniref:DUF1822 family protein n=1 Tax=Drouetiella hepatica Uher 2000/2452 TaxID=904376 RepID=A0A951QED5_9CYAN|nr:DUF1822 family protein [Drouetiella hepatica Uher 2000/2452]
MTDNKDILKELMAIAIPITATDRSRAQIFAKQQPTQARAEQAYRNAIAVLVTRRCLHWLGISSNLEMSDSWNLLNCLLEDAADLYVPQLEGRLECRAIRPGDTIYLIPEDTEQERIGYVVVQLDDTYREGQVLGFFASASTHFSMSDLQPLEALIDRLPMPVNLGEWLNQRFDQGWEPRDNLLSSQKKSILASSLRNRQDEIKQRVEQLYLKQANFNLTPILSAEPEIALAQLIQTTQEDEIRWQAAELLWQLDSRHPDCPVISAKDLGVYFEGRTVALMVGVLPKVESSRLILLRLYPFEQEFHLPPGLKLEVLDETGSQELFQVESRRQDDYIQFKFTGDVGDRFNVRLTLHEASFTESFII